MLQRELKGWLRHRLMLQRKIRYISNKFKVVQRNRRKKQQIKKLNKHCMQMQTFAFVYLIWGWGVYWQLLGGDIRILR